MCHTKFVTFHASVYVSVITFNLYESRSEYSQISENELLLQRTDILNAAFKKIQNSFGKYVSSLVVCGYKQITHNTVFVNIWLWFDH